jgi:hypothetical protein
MITSQQGAFQKKTLIAKKEVGHIGQRAERS